MRAHRARGGETAVALCFALGLCTSLPAAARNKHAAPDWAVEAAKTPTPASAKDAEAVLLSDKYLITVDDQNHAVERERWAIRILKPGGRDDAHCMVEYDKDEKLDYFHAWTISPDGQQFEAKDSDFMDVGAYNDADLLDTERIRRLNPPGNDPGAVVACETERHLRPFMNEEDWQIQASIPFVEESLDLVLPPGGHFADTWSHYASVKPVEVSANRLHWEIKNMPALDLENIHAAPSWEAMAARMSVMWGPSAVNGVANQWRYIGKWLGQLQTGRDDPTPAITAKAQALIAGAPDFYTKLSRITRYIQNNIRYFIVVKGIGGLQAHYASDIFRNGYGDCKDKTTLLIAMLKAVGIHAYYLAVDSERGVINPDAPSLVGNHMITAIEVPSGENDPRLMARVKTTDGKELLIFDPTDEETPVGLIRGQLQGAWGNLADGANSCVIQLPVLPPDSSGIHRKGTFVLAADGSLSGNDTTIYTGGDAADERQYLKSTDPHDVRRDLEQNLGSGLPGLTLTSYDFKDASDLAAPLDLNLHLSVQDYTRRAGTLLLLRPRVFGSNLHPVSDVMDGTKRKYPIVLGHPGQWISDFDITLPSGYAVEETPDPVNVNMKFASYHSDVTVKGNMLQYRSEYVVRQVQIPADEAANFLKLEDVILRNERGMVLLKKQ